MVGGSSSESQARGGALKALPRACAAAQGGARDARPWRARRAHKAGPAGPGTHRWSGRRPRPAGSGRCPGARAPPPRAAPSTGAAGRERGAARGREGAGSEARGWVKRRPLRGGGMAADRQAEAVRRPPRQRKPAIAAGASKRARTVSFLAWMSASKRSSSLTASSCLDQDAAICTGKRGEGGRRGERGEERESGRRRERYAAAGLRGASAARAARANAPAACCRPRRHRPRKRSCSLHSRGGRVAGERRVRTVQGRGRRQRRSPPSCWKEHHSLRMVSILATSPRVADQTSSAAHGGREGEDAR